MHTVFPVDEISDSFWPIPAPEMNRSESVWEFERFLEEVSATPAAPQPPVPGGAAASPVASSTASREEGEDNVVEITKPHRHHQLHPPRPPPPPSDPSPTAGIDSNEYRAFLKSQLDLACAAVALKCGSSVKPGDSAPIADNQSQVSKSSQLGSQANGKGAGHGFSSAQSEADVGPLGILALPPVQKKTGVQVRQTTSESSREDSEDDELDGDTETNENVDPADVKRARRMLSNRESARRSRSRKQAQMGELEAQVSELKVENSSLLERLTDINQKCDGAAVDHRILKADIETLRAKVKMAEERVKQLTGLNPLLLAMSNMSTSGMPFVASPTDVPTNIAVPMLPNSYQFVHQPVPGITSVTPQQQRLNSGFPGNTAVSIVGNPRNNYGGNQMTEMPSMQQMASVEHVHKQIRPSASPSGVVPGWGSELPLAVSKNNLGELN